MEEQSSSVNDSNLNDWLVDFPTEPSRNPTVLRDQVLEKLKQIIDPDLHQDIVTLGFVQHLQIDYDRQKISFSLRLTTPACPIQDEFVSKATQLLHELGWVSDVSIKIDSKSLETNERVRRRLPPNLRNVSNILLVASCKGGVGKSTIACNIAYMLSQLGAKVGLVDTDIYGPSLPYLLPVYEQRIYFTQPSCSALRRHREHLSFEKMNTCCEKPLNPNEQDSNSEYSPEDSEFEEWQESEPEQRMKLNFKHALKTGSGGLLPLIYNNVKLMSYGYLKSLDHAPLRGPVASSVVYQMISHTFWGELDYLVVDTPPGTGDIHLTLTQSFPITGVLMITTPQQLSVVDCEKGLSFFNSFNIKTLALIENMSYFLCNSCDTQHTVFENTEEKIKILAKKYEIPLHIKLPLHKDFATIQFEIHSAQHVQFPFALVFNESHSLWYALYGFAKNLIQQIAIASFSSDKLPVLSIEDKGFLRYTIYKKKKLNKTSSLEEPDPSSNSLPELEDFQTQTFVVNARDIRLYCRCAQCLDQITGRRVVSLRKIDPELLVTSIRYMGNYTVQILWSDGHESLMTFSLLEHIFREFTNKKQITPVLKVSHAFNSCLNTRGNLDW